MTRIPIDPDILLALVRRGYSNLDLADHFRCTQRTIERRRIDDPDLNLAIINARHAIAGSRAQHGSNARYAAGCHCRPCMDANAARCLPYGRAAHARNRHVPRCGRDVVRPRPAPAKKPPATAILIAQAIARGERTTYIMRTLGVTYEAVAAVRDELDEAAGIWPTRTETEEAAA